MSTNVRSSQIESRVLEKTGHDLPELDALETVKLEHKPSQTKLFETLQENIKKHSKKT